MASTIRRALNDWANWKRAVPNGYPPVAAFERARMAGTVTPPGSRIPRGIKDPPAWVIEMDLAIDRLKAQSGPQLRECVGVVCVIYLERRRDETLDALADRIGIAARTLRERRIIGEAALSGWLLRAA